MRHPRKIDPFIAHEMRANGAKLREIAAHFGVTTPAVSAALKRPLRTVQQVAAAHAERMRRRHADPDFAAANAERASEWMRQLHAERRARAVAALDEHARRVYERSVDQGLSHSQSLMIARDDAAIRAKPKRPPAWIAPEALSLPRQIIGRLGRPDDGRKEIGPCPINLGRAR